MGVSGGCVCLSGSRGSVCVFLVRVGQPSTCLGQGWAMVEGAQLGTQRPGFLPLSQTHAVVWAVCPSLSLSFISPDQGGILRIAGASLACTDLKSVERRSTLTRCDLGSQQAVGLCSLLLPTPIPHSVELPGALQWPGCHTLLNPCFYCPLLQSALSGCSLPPPSSLGPKSQSLFQSGTPIRGSLVRLPTLGRKPSFWLPAGRKVDPSLCSQLGLAWDPQASSWT